MGVLGKPLRSLDIAVFNAEILKERLGEREIRIAVALSVLYGEVRLGTPIGACGFV